MTDRTTRMQEIDALIALARLDTTALSTERKALDDGDIVPNLPERVQILTYPTGTGTIIKQDAHMANVRMDSDGVIRTFGKTALKPIARGGRVIFVNPDNPMETCDFTVGSILPSPIPAGWVVKAIRLVTPPLSVVPMTEAQFWKLNRGDIISHVTQPKSEYTVTTDHHHDRVIVVRLIAGHQTGVVTKRDDFDYVTIGNVDGDFAVSVCEIDSINASKWTFVRSA